MSAIGELNGGHGIRYGTMVIAATMFLVGLTGPVWAETPTPVLEEQTTPVDQPDLTEDSPAPAEDESTPSEEADSPDSRAEPYSLSAHADHGHSFEDHHGSPFLPVGGWIRRRVDS